MTHLSEFFMIRIEIYFSYKTLNIGSSFPHEKVRSM